LLLLLLLLLLLVLLSRISPCHHSYFVVAATIVGISVTSPA